MRRSSIEFTTNIGCRNMCDCCPQKIVIEEYKKRSDIVMMTVDAFKTCVDKTPKETIVTFAGYSEPWLNPRATDMVVYAYNKGFPINVFTTLTGMNQGDVLRLSKMVFNQFLIHLPDKSDHFFDDKEQYLGLLDFVCKHISCLGFVYFYNVDKDIMSVVEKHGYTPMSINVMSRSGSLYKLPFKVGYGFCSSVYKYFDMVLPNGDVALCCNDYGLHHILGNLVVGSYRDLHNGGEWRRVKHLMRSSGGGDLICRSCELFVPYLSLRFFIRVVSDFLLILGGGVNKNYDETT